jgi:hypothetical protein
MHTCGHALLPPLVPSLLLPVSSLLLLAASYTANAALCWGPLGCLAACLQAKVCLIDSGMRDDHPDLPTGERANEPTHSTADVLPMYCQFTAMIVLCVR